MQNNSRNASVVVVIPIYKALLTASEQLSLRQCVHILAAYPVRIVKPESLNLEALLLQYPGIEVISFEDEYFLSLDGYNELMISLKFYEQFIAYDYLLIYQLDAFVFKDELAYWCSQKFDYIGSPSLHWQKFDSFTAEAKDDYAKALSNTRFVLNGGLSLRRVKAFIRYLKIYNTFYPAWKGNEDMLFSQEATRLIPMKLFMKLPKWEQAIRFSFEKSPAATFELTGHELPFACHAWERYDPQFWSTYIV